MKSQKHHRAVEVTVAPDGSIQIDAVGFKGSDCEAATKFLEDSLGAATQRGHKPEYHQRSRIHQQQKLGIE